MSVRQRRIRMALGTIVAILATALFSVGGCATGQILTPDSGNPNGCTPSQTKCNGTCTDTSTDSKNCGSCGNACSGTQVCSQGKCGSSCAGGDTFCAPDGGQASCANTQTDPKNCGACGNVCPNNGACTLGKCPVTCPQNQTSCAADGGGDGGAFCTDTQTDNDNCGGCGKPCLPSLQTCTAGQCVSSCGNKTLCIPDGGVPDAGPDGGVPVAHCADTQVDNTDCGTCFHACAGGATCVAGVCKASLIGSGTAADPWHTQTPAANCAAYLAAIPSATDGVYTTHPQSTDINVYCDMTHGGVTYENFGFGQYSKAYTGWTWVGGTDFANATQFDAAFAYLFTRNGGLVNIDVGFVSSNCCFINTGGSNFFGVQGSTYMYPGQGASFACNPSGGYTASIIPLYLVTSNVTISSISSAQAGSVGYYASCTVAGNPAIFVKKY